MAKRALLVGCNYPGESHALRGCVNDVNAIKNMLVNHYGFDENDIMVLIDTDPNGEQPTGANIKRRLRGLVAASEPGDSSVFHYSGHGTQVPSAEEPDLRDEALCPTDMNCITDDDLRTILCGLQDGVKFTMIADCCHSGTLLDQPVVQICGPKSDDPEPPAQLADTFSAAVGSPDKRDVACRALPTDQYLDALAQRLGVPAVKAHQARAAVVAAFGSDATAKLAPLIEKFNEAVSAAGGVENLAKQAVAKLDELVPGAGEAAGGLLSELVGDLTCAAAGDGAGRSRGFGSSLFSLALDLLGDQAVVQQLPPAGAKPSPEAQLPAGKAILVTGCQAEETSADACPSGDPSKAFGALTNALTTIIGTFKQEYPDRNISPMTLVSHVRERLRDARFAQNPCLECDDANARSGFIV